MAPFVRTRCGVALLALIFCATLGASLSGCVPFVSNTQVATCANSPCPGPPFPFAERLSEMSASGAAGSFALKMIDINPYQFRFYYVFKSPQPIGLRVATIAELTASPTTIPLTTSVQVLGHIGAYTAGVIHVTRARNSAQTITLYITPFATSGSVAFPTWSLAPMSQLNGSADAARIWGGLGANPNDMPEAQWSPPVMTQEVSYLRVVISGQPAASRSYVFVRSDDPVRVTVLSKAEYLAIAGTVNFTP